jgi:fructokinase
MPGPIIGLGEVLWDLLPSGPRAGGAPFNFAFHCHQLGHPAVIVGRVGDDQLGLDLRAEVRRLGLSDEFIQIDPGHPTGTVQVAVDSAGQPSYTIAKHVAWDFLEWGEGFGPLIESAQAICYGTLAQRSFKSRETIHRFIASASSFPRKVLTICDLNLRPPFVAPEVVNYSFFHAHWIKMNESEEKMIGRLLTEDGGPTTSERFTHGWPGFCVTLGEHGCKLQSAAESIDIPGIPIRVADTVGAGDAFTAGLVTQLLEGKPLADAARFANALAALVASRPGGTPRVDRAEVETLLIATASERET